MKPLHWALAALAAVIYMGQRRPATAPRATQPSAGATVSPSGGTAISIPGVGTYLNLPDGTVRIGLDPRLFGIQVQDTPTPAPAQPYRTASYDEAVNAAYAPITPYDWIPTAVPNEPTAPLEVWA